MHPQSTSTCVIVLTQGMVTLVDAADCDWLSQWSWCYGAHGYATRGVRIPGTGKQRTILMHREILQAPDGLEVDHVNLDRLDNRRVNLRLATHGQQQQNISKLGRPGKTSQFKGVTYTAAGNWRTRIRHDRRDIHLGLWASETDAALAYDQAARAIFGPFARLNFPEAPTDVLRRLGAPELPGFREGVTPP